LIGELLLKFIAFVNLVEYYLKLCIWFNCTSLQWWVWSILETLKVLILVLIVFLLINVSDDW